MIVVATYKFEVQGIRLSVWRTSESKLISSEVNTVIFNIRKTYSDVQWVAPKLCAWNEWVHVVWENYLILEYERCLYSYTYLCAHFTGGTLLDANAAIVQG